MNAEPRRLGTVYGMNFTHMPELSWTLGYPLAVALMFLTGLALYIVFRNATGSDPQLR